ncbi:MAG: 4-hydroxythreonine-4-phosphate dehydrogenase PdxA [Hyphomicrobium sp.]
MPGTRTEASGSPAFHPCAAAPLALTMGDPGGIGPDITLKAFQARSEYGLQPFAVFGAADVYRARARRLGITLAVEEIEDLAETRAVFAHALPIVPINLAAPVEPGRPDSANGQAVIAAIDAAVAAVAHGRARALVTNPIAKAVLYAAGFAHPGHTEYLAECAMRHWPQSRPYHPVMMLACDDLKVVPLTIHVALSSVPGLISKALIFETVATTAAALRQSFGIAAPRIAIAGLNPHAGEGGAIGREDVDIIAPAVRQLVQEGYAVSGPHSADTLFHAVARRGYDAVIAMYHDQALIPIKTLAFDEGVNITLGLPFVRTSPDHGTAFDIAGTGSASALSLIHALKAADAMAQQPPVRRAGSGA